MKDKNSSIKLRTKKYIDKEIHHLWCRISLIFKKNAKARKEAQRLMEIRLDGMNNIHGQLKEQTRTFVTQDQLKLLEQKAEGLQKLVYIGFGIFLVLQVILVFVLASVFNK